MVALKFVHEHNYFKFAGELFRQRDGIAMGTTCAVVLCCLFLGILEEKMFSTTLFSACKVQLFRRFIDDGFIVAQGKSTDAGNILMLIRALDPNIRITEAVSDNSAIFLDVCIFKGERFEETGILSSRVYQKEMNLFQYLPTHSAHSGKVFRFKPHLRGAPSISDPLERRRVIFRRRLEVLLPSLTTRIQTRHD